MTDVAWQVERVSFRHPGASRDAVRDVTCQLAGGGVTAILGPNGAGKSTFVRLLIGLAAPTSGIVQFRGRSLGSWPRGAIAREIGFVPQGEESVFPMTVREVVAMGRYPHLGPWRAESQEDRRLVRHALEDVDAFPFADRPFSHAEWRRAAAGAHCPGAGTAWIGHRTRRAHRRTGRPARDRALRAAARPGVLWPHRGAGDAQPLPGLAPG